MPTVPAPTDPAFQSEILAAHNGERRALGIADLVWSRDLAKEAQDWAATLAKTGRMAHARQSRHGENLSSAPVGRATPTELVARWLAEKPNYIPGSAQPNTSRTGNWADVGHYTAVVWSATREIGCAVGRGQAIDFLVCRYNPPGNVRGYAAYDVKVAAAAAARAAEAKPAPQPAPAKPAAKPAVAPASDKTVIPVPKPKPVAVAR